MVVVLVGGDEGWFDTGLRVDGGDGQGAAVHGSGANWHDLGLAGSRAWSGPNRLCCIRTAITLGGGGWFPFLCCRVARWLSLCC
jgi:hypothetical protein